MGHGHAWKHFPKRESNQSTEAFCFFTVCYSLSLPFPKNNGGWWSYIVFFNLYFFIIFFFFLLREGEKENDSEKATTVVKKRKRKRKRKDGQNLNLENFSSIIINFDYLYRNAIPIFLSLILNPPSSIVLIKLSLQFPFKILFQYIYIYIDITKWKSEINE